MGDVSSSAPVPIGSKSRIGEIYEYRNVLRSLIEKGLFGRYKNSFLGFAWHFAMPLIYVALCFFLNDRSSEDGYYWVLVGSGILAFHMLTSAVAGGTTCFTGNSGIIKKMYVPKEILPIARATTDLIVMAIGYAALIVIMLVAGYPLNPLAMLLLIPLALAMYLFCIGCMLALSSITVYVRDVQYMLGTMGIAFFVLSPLRSFAAEAEGIRATIMWMNPFTYYLESFHSILYAGEIPDLTVFGMCFLLAGVALVAGYLIYGRLKNGIVERL